MRVHVKVIILCSGLCQNCSCYLFCTLFFSGRATWTIVQQGQCSTCINCGNTGVLKPNKVIDAEGCTIGSCIMLLSWSCIMYSVSGCIAVPYSPVLKSTGGSPQITMRVINQGSEELSLYWVKYIGGTRSYGKVQAGEPWVVITYGTHPWLITNPNDQIVGISIPYTAAKILIS